MNSNTLDKGEIELANGCRVRIRPLRRGEHGPVRELFARLSPRTRYLRFLSTMAELPDSLLRTLADVDNPRHLALVAELGNAASGEVVALGNVGVRHDNRAEMGLVVADAWQRQGIGVALAGALLQAAELRGCRQFVVHGAWHNSALRPLLNHVAEIVSTNTRAGVSEITFVRRRHAPAYTRALRGLVSLDRGAGSGSTIGVDGRPDLLEQAYQRILAKGGRE